MVGDVASEVVRPFGRAFFAGKPVIGGGVQGGEHIRVNLAAPGENFLGGAVAPAQVDEAVAIRPIETTLFGRAPAVADGGGFRVSSEFTLDQAGNYVVTLTKADHTKHEVHGGILDPMNKTRSPCLNAHCAPGLSST